MAAREVGRSEPGAIRATNGAPIWTAATVGLLLLGFRRPPYAEMHRRRGTRPSPEGREGRGRSATFPTQFGTRAWKDILLRVYHNIGDHRIVAIAAGVTFYGLLAIFPATAALVALYGLFTDPAAITGQLDNLSGFLPSGALEVLRDQMTRVAGQHNSTLGATFLGGLAVSIWSANAGMKALFDALNLVHGEKENRGLIALNVQTLAFTTAAIIFVIAATGAMLALPYLLDALGLTDVTKLLVRAVRWIGLLLVIVVGLALLYRYGPSRAAPRWRWVTVGSAVAAVVWLIASVLFSWYAEHFGSYNATYGSLGAVIGFLVWMWLSTIVILLGAELDAEMEHQTARDTTTGPSKPLGACGARMADTVGAA
jgi:membrane protein